MGKPDPVSHPMASAAGAGRSGTQKRRVAKLPGSAGAPVEARRVLAGVPGLGGDLGYRVLLLGSEAVTAAVLALEAEPRSTIELAIDVDDERVRVEVRPRRADPASSHPVLSHYGAQIFRRMAAGWGVENDPEPMVWFELAR